MRAACDPFQSRRARADLCTAGYRSDSAQVLRAKDGWVEGEDYVFGVAQLHLIPASAPARFTGQLIEGGFRDAEARREVVEAVLITRRELIIFA